MRLSVALARSRRSVLVVDAGEPRNAPAHGVHNLLGQEGRAPAELLAAGRAELAGYGGTVVSGTAVAARQVSPEGFAVELGDGSTVRARRLLVATGLVDELPGAERLELLPFCGHLVPEERPVELAALIGGLLARPAAPVG